MKLGGIKKRISLQGVWISILIFSRVLCLAVIAGEFKHNSFYAVLAIVWLVTTWDAKLKIENK